VRFFQNLPRTRHRSAARRPRPTRRLWTIIANSRLAFPGGRGQDTGRARFYAYFTLRRGSARRIQSAGAAGPSRSCAAKSQGNAAEVDREQVDRGVSVGAHHRVRTSLVQGASFATTS
jgi:hypothetical protein